MSLLLVATGCIKAVQPFYDVADAVHDSLLWGTWEGTTLLDPTHTQRWTVVGGLNAPYELTPSSGGDNFEGALFKVEDRLFLDVAIENYSQPFRVPLHNLLEVVRTSNTVTLLIPYDLASPVGQRNSRTPHMRLDGPPLMDSSSNLYSRVCEFVTRRRTSRQWGTFTKVQEWGKTSTANHHKRLSKAAPS